MILVTNKPTLGDTGELVLCVDSGSKKSGTGTAKLTLRAVEQLHPLWRVDEW